MLCGAIPNNYLRLETRTSAFDFGNAQAAVPLSALVVGSILSDMHGCSSDGVLALGLVGHNAGHIIKLKLLSLRVVA